MYSITAHTVPALAITDPKLRSELGNTKHAALPFSKSLHDQPNDQRQIFLFIVGRKEDTILVFLTPHLVF